MLHSFELWSCRCETNHFSTITSTTDCVVALVIVCSWDLWSFGRKPFCLWRVWTYLNVVELIWTICSRNEKLLILSGSLLGISTWLESSLLFPQKPHLGFCDLGTLREVEPTSIVGSSPSERNRECVLSVVCCLEWFERESTTHVCFREKSLWGNLATIGIVLVFRAKLSGAKFYGCRSRGGWGCFVLFFLVLEQLWVNAFDC